jgi:signal transduction histidine kinase/CheY-like chemotaxis protein
MAKPRESDVNLEELREQLSRRVAWVLIVVSSVALLSLLIARGPLRWAPFGLWSFLFCLGWAVTHLLDRRAGLARHLLVWGGTASFLLALWRFPLPWLPFLGLMLPFVAALVVSGGGFVAVGSIFLLTLWRSDDLPGAYPLTALYISLAVSLVLAWLSVRTLYTALEWAWTMQQRTVHLLEVARDREGELNRALKSLHTSNALLQRTQRELVFARQQAEKARLMKEQFAANVSHELRTPLNLILGFSEVMYLSSEVYGDLNWPPALRQDVYQIYSSSRHLMEMINDVLDLSRFEITGFTLNREPTALAPLLEEALEIAGDLFRNRPMRLVADIAEDLPTLALDRTRIRQVLLNLLNNAARFTEEGAVYVTARVVEDVVQVCVRDTGPGIAPEEREHIFEEFYQVDRSLHRKSGGAGLGLAICKRFVQAHDGRIWVESVLGEGATFYFTLPIPGQHIPLAPTMRTPALPVPQLHFPILVVDPDPAVASLIDRHLEAYDVLRVDGPGEVTEAIRLHHPKAVIYNAPPARPSPDLNVVTAPVPVVVCSLPSRVWMAGDFNVVQCLVKPVTAQQLLDVVERVGHVRRVLVVDDDWGFGQMVTRMLEATGEHFEVRRAYGGQEALTAMRAAPPDLLLLDLVMPQMDGLQVLKAMQQTPALAGVPVVLVTGDTPSMDAEAPEGHRIIIRRSDSMSVDEVLRCLRAVVEVLEPRYDERSVPSERLVPDEVSQEVDIA